MSGVDAEKLAINIFYSAKKGIAGNVVGKWPLHSVVLSQGIQQCVACDAWKQIRLSRLSQ
jgi:hypothetical protein